MDLFLPEEREVVAFVGGGGKSTLLLGLGHELADAGRPVVMTSTTKMGTDQIPPWAVVCHNLADVDGALRSQRPAYLLAGTDGAKVIGVDPDLVNDVAAATTATVLVEADGSRRRPFKAPASHEPVVPSATTLVVVAVGVEAIGQPISVACHRPERVSTLTGRSVNDVVRPEDIATVAAHPAGGRKGVPEGARLILAITKVERNHAQAVEQIRSSLANQIEVVAIGSH